MIVDVFSSLSYVYISIKLISICNVFLDTNILVNQTCSCVSPLQCVCPGDSGVTYVLVDMDLFCLQGEKLTGKYLDWADEKFNEPAGTHGLKPAEVWLNM